MLIELPLIMSNGNFKSLKALNEAELEAFIKYLMEFLCQKENLNTHQKPNWWSDSIPFPIYFIQGTEIPYVRNKLLHMRKMIKTCYLQRGLLDLLSLSENLSKLHSFQIHYRKNTHNHTITVYKDGSPVVIIPEKNINYDYKRKRCDAISIFSVQTIDPEVTVYTKCETAKKSTGGKRLNDFLNKKTLKSPLIDEEIIELDDSDPELDIVENTEKNKMDDDDVVLIEDSDDDCVITNVINLPKPKLSPQKNRLLLSKKCQNKQLNEIQFKYCPKQEEILIKNMKLLKKHQIEQQKKQQEFLFKRQILEKKQAEEQKKQKTYLRNRQLLKERKKQQLELQKKQEQQPQHQSRKSKRKLNTRKRTDLIVLSEDEEYLDDIITANWIKMEKEDKETTQDMFLNKFDLVPRSSPKIPISSNSTNIVPVEKERITNIFFSKLTDLSMIPLMVNIGMIPKKCLTISNPSIVEKRSILIENLTNKTCEIKSNIETLNNKKSVQYSLTPCSVVVEKLSQSTIVRLNNGN